MPDDPKIPENGPEGEIESAGTAIPQAESLAQRPDETFDQYLKRLSQMPRIGNGRVKLSNLGPITIISTAPAKPPKDDPKS